MGNLMSMRGGFLGQLISGGATQREKDSSTAAGLLMTAARVLARFASIAISLRSTIYQLDISTQETNAGQKNDGSSLISVKRRRNRTQRIVVSTPPQLAGKRERARRRRTGGTRARG